MGKKTVKKGTSSVKTDSAGVAAYVLEDVSGVLDGKAHCVACRVDIPPDMVELMKEVRDKGSAGIKFGRHCSSRGLETLAEKVKESFKFSKKYPFVLSDELSKDFKIVPDGGGYPYVIMDKSLVIAI